MPLYRCQTKPFFEFALRQFLKKSQDTAIKNKSPGKATFGQPLNCSQAFKHTQITHQAHFSSIILTTTPNKFFCPAENA